MKSSKSLQIVLISILIAMAIQSSVAQSHPILGKFRVSVTDGVVFLSWAIVAGSTCNGIQIYRSTDSITFTQIGAIPGICGSTTFSQPYDFTDNNPAKNKVNYYRLELGGYGFSQTLSVELINLEFGNYQIRPNPITSEGKIYFSNDRKQEYRITLHNLNGAEVFSATTREDFFQINVLSLQSGAYIFNISDLENLPFAKGKLLIHQ